MSLKVSGERLLAEALADAMDRDMAGVPPREQLEQQHRFSKKFVRRMKRLERAASDNREIPTTVNSSEKSDAKERKTVDFRRLGAAAKRYSGLAAAFVCVIGLAAVVGVMSRSLRMGKSGTAEGIAESAAADTAAPEEAWDDVAGEPSAEAAEEAAGSETPENNAPNSITDNGTPEDEKGEQAMVPDWQEQLLLESAKADELVTWHLNMIYDDGSIGLTSDVVNPSDSSVATPGQSLYVSGVFEVYYEQRPDEWDCIYRTKRTRDNYSAATSWDEWYALDELYMTQAGTYRLVRQVNSYRQVLQLTLEEQ